MTESPKSIKLPSGTMFGCKKPKTSQPVVIKTFKGYLEPGERK